MKQTEFIALCQKEFETYDVVFEKEWQAIVDGKFRVVFDGVDHFEIIYLGSHS